MAWVGKDSKNICLQSPDVGHLSLEQVHHSSIQPGLEQFQERGNHKFPAQPVPVPHQAHREEFFSYYLM